GRAPTGGTCLQRIEHKWITAVVERQPAAAELVDAPHSGKVAGGLFYHRDVVYGLKHPDQQFRAHIDAASGGIVVHHDRNPDRVTNAEKMLKNFAFGKLPVRHLQDHPASAPARCAYCARRVVFAVVTSEPPTMTP